MSEFLRQLEWLEKLKWNKLSTNTQSKVWNIIDQNDIKIINSQTPLNRLLNNQNNEKKDLDLALQEFILFLEKNYPWDFIVWKFTDNSDLEDKKEYFKQLEVKHKIKIIHLITYLYENQDNLKVFSTFRWLDTTHSKTQIISKDKKIIPNKKEIDKQIWEWFKEAEIWNHKEKIWIMNAWYISPFIEWFNPEDTSIIFDQDAINNLISHDQACFIEIVRWKNSSYSIPLRFFLTFLSINWLYSFEQTEKAEKDEEINENIKNLFASFKNWELNKAFENIKWQDAFQRYWNLKKALKEYIKSNYIYKNDWEAIWNLVENFFRNFWNVEIRLCIEIALWNDVEKNYTELTNKEYFKYLIPKELHANKEETIAFIQKWDLKNITNNIKDSYETAKTSEYFNEQEKLINYFFNLRKTWTLREISEWSIDKYINNLKNALELAYINETDWLKVKHRTRKNIVSNLVNLLFWDIIKLVESIKKDLEKRKQYFINWDFDLYILFFWNELSKILSNPLYKEIWANDESMLKDIFKWFFKTNERKTFL